MAYSTLHIKHQTANATDSNISLLRKLQCIAPQNHPWIPLCGLMSYSIPIPCVVRLPLPRVAVAGVPFPRLL